MNEGIKSLARKQTKITRDIRLLNWGLWNRTGSNPNLDYTTWGDIFSFYLGEPGGKTINDLDAQLIENVITTLDITGRAGVYPWTELQAFVLRLEYMERAESSQKPQSERAKDVSRKFKRPFATRTYRYHLYNAKRVVFLMITDI